MKSSGLVAFKHGSRAAFTLLEVMLAMSFLGMVLGAVTAATIAYRDAITVTGIETLNGKRYALSPDTSSRSAANVLGAELMSLATGSRFTVTTDRPLTRQSLLNLHRIPSLRGLSSPQMQSPSGVRSYLESLGAEFQPSGYSILLFGPNLRVLGAVNVVLKTGSASNLDSFVTYDVELFGDYDAGYGLLYAYQFASAAETAQPARYPQLNLDTWKVTLPDPMVTDSSLTEELLHRLTYEIPSGL